MYPTIFFRADGNSTIGLGHVIRSIALVSILKKSFNCVFVIKNPSEPLALLLNKECNKVYLIDAETSVEDEKKFFLKLITMTSTVVLDGYHFHSEFQKSIKQIGCKLVCIDDIANVHFYADYIINHCGGNILKNYKTEPYTSYCFGPAYALLRSSFRTASQQSRNFNLKQIFVNMGGSDPNNDTLLVLQKINQLELQNISQIIIVVGSAYPFKTELENYIQNQIHKIKFYINVDEDQICALMATCGVAICSASTIAYEYASVGGILYVIKTQNNQEDLFNFLITSGLALKFRQKDISINEILFNRILEIQRSYFDGKSDKRLLELFINLEKEKEINLRNTLLSDLKTYFIWANDLILRQFSLTKNSIDIDTHSLWFNKKIIDVNCYMFVAEINHNQVGNIRFDYQDNCFLISYMIDEMFRGKGIGAMLVKLGIEKICNNNIKYNNKFKAIVSENNIASIKIFEKLGFIIYNMENINEENFLTFTKE